MESNKSKKPIPPKKPKETCTIDSFDDSSAGRSNEKILVLGHGENIYIPCRIASYIKGDVNFKSTTRSPIYCDDVDGYPSATRC